MIGVTVFAREGLMGAREQFRDFRKRKSGERRARRTEKGGEAMPEEATEVHDKQELYYRRFNKRLRDRLKATGVSKKRCRELAREVNQEGRPASDLIGVGWLARPRLRVRSR